MLRDGGCEVATVLEQGLCSSSDADLIEVCRDENRVLISLDTDFASILRFPPHRYAGIVVLRLPEPTNVAAIEDALRRLLAASSGIALDGKLWVVDHQRIREYGGPEL